MFSDSVIDAGARALCHEVVGSDEFPQADWDDSKEYFRQETRACLRAVVDQACEEGMDSKDVLRGLGKSAGDMSEALREVKEMLFIEALRREAENE